MNTKHHYIDDDDINFVNTVHHTFFERGLYERFPNTELGLNLKLFCLKLYIERFKNEAQGNNRT